MLISCGLMSTERSPVTPERAARLMLLQRVRAATRSPDPTIRIEGQIARRFRRRLHAFQHEVRVAGRRVGEIDVELDDVIIEVTSGRGRKKFQQIQRLMHNRDLNPGGKRVVVFGPQLREGLIWQLEQSSAIVVHTLEDLERLVSRS